MRGRRKNIFSENIVRNLIISLIAVVITLYFYYRPFNNSRVFYNQGDKGNLLLNNEEGSPSVPQSKGGDYEILYMAGMKNYSEGHLEEAVSLLEKAFEFKETEDVKKSIQRIYNLLAVKRIDEGKIDDARLFYDKAIEISPLKSLILEKSNTYTLTGEQDKAVAFLEKFRENYEDDADYIVVLSNILYESGKPEMAYENLVDILNKVNAHTSAQMLKRRIEDEYSVIDINLQNGKRILSLDSKIENGKLAENFIYSAAGEVYFLLSSVYALNINKKVSLILSPSDSYSIPQGPGYNTAAISSIYVPVELLIEAKDSFRKTLKYLIAKKALSSSGKVGEGNILYEGIALKAAGYSFWGGKDEKYLDSLHKSDFLKALEQTQWSDFEKDAGIYRILSSSFADFLLIEYSGKMISDIIVSEKNGLSFKKSLGELTRKKEDELLNMWIKYFRNQTGRM